MTRAKEWAERVDQARQDVDDWLDCIELVLEEMAEPLFDGDALLEAHDELEVATEYVFDDMDVLALLQALRDDKEAPR